ncbi:MAG: hypothetical protein J6B75_06640 [Ruminococcus sp.]|nr:hypothetical protein [Ruminococcus sp.]
MSKNNSSQPNFGNKSNKNCTDSKSNSYSNSNQPDFGGKPEKGTSTSSSKNSY